MRAFITLCLITLAAADKLGYNYQPVAHSNNGLSFNPGSNYVQPNNEYLAPIRSDHLNSVSSNSASEYSAQNELEKEFYVFSAPESDSEDANAIQRALGYVKQGLRVVFIKNPENHAFENAALALARQAAQQQTAIYVLNKQADIEDLANKLNAAGKNSDNKPQVHFVKYRTAEDASNAQHAIQSQYDSLGGKSHNVNAGVASVINFASQAAAVPLSSVQKPESSYLPSSIFRLRF